MKTVNTLIALGLLSAALHAPAALAATFDAKNYPGATCQAFRGSDESVLVHTQQGTFNNGSATLNVTCPVVRDNIANQNGTYKPASGALNFGAEVYVDNQGGANALVCKLYSNDKFGNNVSASSAASPVGQQVLSLNVNSSVPVTGHYVLVCALPPKSSVRSYQVYEYLNTDSDS
jgi:hypothetical protein